MKKNVLISILFIVIALGFGIPAMQYNVGTISNPGPGLFPLGVSALLLIIGIISYIDSRLEDSDYVNFNLKNISIITVALVLFALATDYINMSVGIVTLVAVASISATTYSYSRVIKISIGLIAIATAFKYLLGLNLPLF